MSDHDPLRTHFTAYRADLMARIDGPGPEAARRTLHRRRRNAVVAGAALAVVLVVAPIAAAAALRDAAPPPTTTPTPWPTPSTALSPSAGPSPSTGGTPSAPDGRITEAQLLAARLDLPAWPGENCADTTDVRLLPGDTTQMQRPYLIAVAHGDVDADGAVETVALLGCRVGEASLKQAVALDRDAAERIVTLGRVVRTEGEHAEAIEDILAVAVEDGTVRVQVADLQPCCSIPAYWARRQWREYGWTGDRFTQTGGPTKWGRDPRLTDLALSAGPLALGPPDQRGERLGSVTLTVTNRGQLDVDRVAFYELDQIGEPDGGAWDRCEPEQAWVEWPPCMVAGVPAGEQRSWTFRFRFGPDGLPQAPAARVVHYGADFRYWEDLTRDDNHVRIQVDR